MALIIIKADGTKEEFDAGKLVRSLTRAGASGDTASRISAQVEKELHSGATTRDIYRRAFEYLHKEQPVIAASARYSLKRAVFEFGPSGFPFEKYLAEIFRVQGYSASTDRIIRGRCVEHEVDVVMEKAGEQPERVYVEAKFHHGLGFKTDEQTALYVQARVEDIVEGLPPEEAAFSSGMLATNTKFTTRAIQYANCRKLRLLAWEYPEHGNLHDLIEQTKQYPITILESLSGAQKQKLLEAGIVLCRNVVERPELLHSAGIDRGTIERAQKEAARIVDLQ